MVFCAALTYSSNELQQSITVKSKSLPSYSQAERLLEFPVLPGQSFLQGCAEGLHLRKVFRSQLAAAAESLNAYVLSPEVGDEALILGNGAVINSRRTGAEQQSVLLGRGLPLRIRTFMIFAFYPSVNVYICIF